MGFLCVVTTILIAAQAAFSSPVRIRSPYAVKESHYVPNKWTNLGFPDPEHRINLQIGLKQGNFDELEKHLWEGISKTLYSA